MSTLDEDKTNKMKELHPEWFSSSNATNPTKVTRKPWTYEEECRFRSLVETGETYDKIAETLNKEFNNNRTSLSLYTHARVMGVQSVRSSNYYRVPENIKVFVRRTYPTYPNITSEYLEYVKKETGYDLTYTSLRTICISDKLKKDKEIRSKLQRYGADLSRSIKKNKIENIPNWAKNFIKESYKTYDGSMIQFAEYVKSSTGYSLPVRAILTLVDNVEEEPVVEKESIKTEVQQNKKSVFKRILNAIGKVLSEV